MDLTFKQKMIAFGVMLLIFTLSIIIKTWISSDSFISSGNSELKISETTDSNYANSEIDNSGAAEKDESGIIHEDELIIVDVEGAVLYPGIVKARSGSRVYQLIEKAGGLLDNADTKYVNLAEEVNDGIVIYIPFQGEESSETSSDTGTSRNNGLININTAGKTELMELPGIGEAYSEAIIEYREDSGTFKKIEDLMNVPGIGESKFEKLSELICVY